MMKIALILECPPQGTDEQVYSHLARRFFPEIELRCEALVNKPRLIAGCGEVAAQLLADGYERVGVIWDLFPPWRIEDEEHCLGQDRDEILASLQSAGAGPPQVQLVCVREELEAWLIADDRALTKLLSRPTRAAKDVQRIKRPERQRDPKGYLTQLFRVNGHGPYTPLIHALRIIQGVEDWTRIRRCPSFVRFVERVLDCSL